MAQLAATLPLTEITVDAGSSGGLASVAAVIDTIETVADRTTDPQLLEWHAAANEVLDKASSDGNTVKSQQATRNQQLVIKESNVRIGPPADRARRRSARPGPVPGGAGPIAANHLPPTVRSFRAVCEDGRRESDQDNARGGHRRPFRARG